MGAGCCRWNHSQPSKPPDEGKAYEVAGVIIATTPPYGGRFGGSYAINAAWWACAFRPVLPAALRTAAPVAARQRKHIALQMIGRGGLVGSWLWCETCGFNGDRDYCASLNIARLGMTYLLQMNTQARRALARSLTHRSSLCRIPAQARRCCCRRRGPTPPDMCGERSVTLLVGSVRLSCRPSQPKAVFLRLYG